MELTRTEVNDLTDWFKAKFPYRIVCEVCASAKFEFPALIYTPQLLTPTYGVTTLTPCVNLHCIDCGNIKTFAAIKLEDMGCPVFKFKPKKNVFSFLDYFKRKKKW